MRAFDRDLIRGEHYGQRPSVPRSKAEHMAAPTNAAGVKKALANPEPSTHGLGCARTVSSAATRHAQYWFAVCLEDQEFQSCRADAKGFHLSLHYLQESAQPRI